MMPTNAGLNNESQTGYSFKMSYPQPTVELKPCPFCGSVAVAYDKPFPHVRCSSKECEIALFEDTLENAIKKWNRRARE